MAENKIRLINHTRFNIGIITPEKPHGYNIVPNGFALCTRDEVDFLMATTTLFTRGFLKVKADPEQQQEIEEQLNIDTENNANFMSDEDIRKKLSGTAPQLKKWLEAGEVEPFVLTRIAEIAKGMNLSMNKVQVLQDKIPGFEFISK